MKHNLASPLVRGACIGTLFSTAIGGCAVGPNYRQSTPCTMPVAWSHGDPVGPPGPARVTTRPASVARWWKTLNDPMLDSLIERAVQTNLDLRVAEARVRQSRMARGIQVANFFPMVETTASYDYEGASATTAKKLSSGSSSGGSSKLPSITITPAHPDGSGGTVPGTITVNPPSGSGSSGGSSGGTSIGDRGQNMYQAGFDATWEIDVFGGIRRSVESADADLAAACESYRDVLITLLAEVASNYVQVRGIQRRIVLTKENIDTQSDTYKLTQTRFKAGLTGELDVVRADAQLNTTSSQVPALEIQLKQAIYQLGVLLGQTPESLLVELSADKPIPVPPADIPVGLPSDLLRRRPDVRQAERQLASATAQIGVATADLFPKFTLTGSYGVRSAHSEKLFDSQSTTWMVGPNVQWPIFQGGRILSNIGLQEAIRDQQAAVYTSTVLTALRDVEGALVAYVQERIRHKELSDAVTANRRAVSLSEELYSRGLSDFLSVLVAQQNLFVTEDAMVQSQQTVVLDLIALYKALGGGWDLPDEPQETP
jgi:outer membrane protein, multidrug efflux system